MCLVVRISIRSSDLIVPTFISSTCLGLHKSPDRYAALILTFPTLGKSSAAKNPKTKRERGIIVTPIVHDGNILF